MRRTLSEGITIIPGYRLVQFLGKGGFGEVWRATGPGKVPLALKIIELKGSRAGEREFKSLDLLRELRHPNLLPLQGYWLVDDAGQVIEDDRPATTLVIAMLLGGKNLRQRLDECQQAGFSGIPARELIEYMRDAAKGIDYLNSPTHQLGDTVVSIQHRDIKPENLLIVGGGVMLADFGIARVMEQSSSSLHTETAAMTIWYAAPELFDFKSTIWTDQYALAITYCELRAGRLPFPAECSPTQAMVTHMRSGHDFSGMSADEVDILRRATSVAPESRFASCTELVTNLEAAVRADSAVWSQAMGPSGAGTASSLRSIASKPSTDRPPQQATMAYQGDAVALGDAGAPANAQVDQASRSLSDPALRATDGSLKDDTKTELPAGSTERPISTANAVTAQLHSLTVADPARSASDSTAARSRVGPWIVAAAVLVAVPVAWFARGIFRRNDVDAASSVISQHPTDAQAGGAPEKKDDPAERLPADPAAAARSKAAAAESDGRFKDVIEAMSSLVQDKLATLADFQTRARAYVALAQGGSDPENNFRRAADDFARADSIGDQANTLAQLGEWLRAGGKHSDALVAFTKSNELKESPAGLLAVCELQLATGAVRESREAADRLLAQLGDRDPDELTARAHRACGRAHLKLADELDKAKPRDDEPVTAADRKAEEHLNAAAGIATELKLKDADEYSNELAALRDTARFANRIKMSQLMTAIADLRKELEKTPNAPKLLLELAEAHRRAGQDKEAKSYAVRGHGRQAIELALDGKDGEAEKSLVEASALDPDHPFVLFAHGLVDSHKGDLAAALRSLTAALEKAPANGADRGNILAARAAVYARQADRSPNDRVAWQRARDDAESALATATPPEPPGPNEPINREHRTIAELHFVRAAALDATAGSDRGPATTRQLEEAEQSYNKAVVFNSQDARFSIGASRNLMRRSRGLSAAQTAETLKRVDELIRKAIEIDPNLADAYAARGDLRLLQGKVDLCRADYEKAIEIAASDPSNPRQGSYRIALASAFMRPPVDNDKALAAADAAVARDQANAEGHFVRGRALRNLKRTADALAAFDAALALQPKHVGSLLVKSQLVIEMENATTQQLDQASRDIATAMAEASNDDQKGDAFYVRSLAALKTHVSNMNQPATAEPSLIQVQRDLIAAIRLVPSNAVYSTTATDIFKYTAGYGWRDAKLKSESEQLQQDLKALRTGP
jgi:serine/threonine protein kinase/tetratricopeptide (TPR) repeat protein